MPALFSGTLLGYVIPLSSAAINAVSIPDYFAWGGIALVIQLLVFAGVRLYRPALSEKIINAVSIPDYFAWGGIALVIQLLVFAGVRLYRPALSEKIINHTTAAGMFMGTAALAGGILNAACMTW